MTRYSKNFGGGMAPLAPPATPMAGSQAFSTILCNSIA